MNKKPISHTEQRFTFLFGRLIGPTTVTYNVSDEPHYPHVASHANLPASLHSLYWQLQSFYKWLLVLRYECVRYQFLFWLVLQLQPRTLGHLGTCDPVFVAASLGFEVITQKADKEELNCGN